MKIQMIDLEIYFYSASWTLSLVSMELQLRPGRKISTHTRKIYQLSDHCSFSLRSAWSLKKLIPCDFFPRRACVPRCSPGQVLWKSTDFAGSTQTIQLIHQISKSFLNKLVNIDKSSMGADSCAMETVSDVDRGVLWPSGESIGSLGIICGP